MPHRRHDAVGLHAAGGLGCHQARKQRILTHIFGISPVPGVARQVDAAGEQHVERLCPRLSPDQCTPGIGDRRIEAGGGGQAGGQGGGGISYALLDLVGHAETCIALAQRRDPETRYPRHVARRGDHVGMALSGHRREQAMGVLQLLRPSHRRNQRARTSTAGMRVSFHAAARAERAGSRTGSRADSAACATPPSREIASASLNDMI